MSAVGPLAHSAAGASLQETRKTLITAAILLSALFFLIIVKKVLYFITTHLLAWCSKLFYPIFYPFFYVFCELDMKYDIFKGLLLYQKRKNTHNYELVFHKWSYHT